MRKKCKICGEEINLFVFGKPDDICFGCLTNEEKDILAKKNLELANNMEWSSY